MVEERQAKVVNDDELMKRSQNAQTLSNALHIRRRIHQPCRRDCMIRRTSVSRLTAAAAAASLVDAAGVKEISVSVQEEVR